MPQYGINGSSPARYLGNLRSTVCIKEQACHTGPTSQRLQLDVAQALEPTPDPKSTVACLPRIACAIYTALTAYYHDFRAVYRTDIVPPAIFTSISYSNHRSMGSRLEMSLVVNLQQD